MCFKNKNPFFGIGLFIFFISAVSPACTLAQDSFSLSVSPPTSEFNVSPGDTIENSVRVENLTNNPISVSVDYRNFVAVGEEGAVNLTIDGNDYSLNKWIKSDTPAFIIPARNRQIFIYKIHVPSNAEPGGHFGSIVFKSIGPESPTPAGAIVSQEIASLILVKVSGVTTEKASLISFQSLKKFWEYGPVTFENRVKNDGNIQVKPVGTVVIKNIFNHEVASLKIDPKNILPGAIRKNTIKWNKKYLFGRYTATQLISYGNPTQNLVTTTVFYGFPYKIIILIFLISSLITFLVYRARKRLKKAIKILFSKE